jgi:hypothetical protein
VPHRPWPRSAASRLSLRSLRALLLVATGVAAILAVASLIPLPWAVIVVLVTALLLVAADLHDDARPVLAGVAFVLLDGCTALASWLLLRAWPVLISAVVLSSLTGIGSGALWPAAKLVVVLGLAVGLLSAARRAHDSDGGRTDR